MPKLERLRAITNTISDTHRLFHAFVSLGMLSQGYSYVAPSILFTDNAVSRDIFGHEMDPSQQSSLSDMFANHFVGSTFFQTYNLDQMGQSLGTGSFSTCWRCCHRKSKQEYAVKIVSRRVDCSQEESLLRICQGHPNVVKLEEVHQDRAHTFFVMELLSGGELLQKRHYTEREAQRVMRQLTSAVRFMHSHGVVHRDLKPENIVYAYEGEDAPVKIVDFGFARLKSCEPLHTPCFTLPYAAPEVIAKQDYDESCDMWSLGTILYFMLSGSPPFGIGSPDVAARIKAGQIDFSGTAWRNVSAAAKRVTMDLLVLDPSKRLTAAALANHPWLARNISDVLTPSFDVTQPDHAVASTSTMTFARANEGFQLRAVDAAKLAQRRKHKRSTSHSSLSSTASRPSSSSSSPLSVQLLRPPSTTTSIATTSASPARPPSVFDFSEERVNEYLSSLSSSSDSNSPRLSHRPEKHRQEKQQQQQQRPDGLVVEALRQTAKRRKRDSDLASPCQPETSTKRERRDVESGGNSGGTSSSSGGPMTRSRKRKLEQMVSGSESSAESYESSSQSAQDEASVHRKHKAAKRSRFATIVVE